MPRTWLRRRSWSCCDTGRRVSRYDRPGAWVRRVAIRKAVQVTRREARRSWFERRAAATTVSAGPQPSAAAPDDGLVDGGALAARPTACRGRAVLLRGPVRRGRGRRPGMLGVDGQGASPSCERGLADSRLENGVVVMSDIDDAIRRDVHQRLDQLEVPDGRAGCRPSGPTSGEAGAGERVAVVGGCRLAGVPPSRSDVRRPWPAVASSLSTEPANPLRIVRTLSASSLGPGQAAGRGDRAERATSTSPTPRTRRSPRPPPRGRVDPHLGRRRHPTGTVPAGERRDRGRPTRPRVRRRLRQWPHPGVHEHRSLHPTDGHLRQRSGPASSSRGPSPSARTDRCTSATTARTTLTKLSPNGQQDWRLGGHRHAARSCGPHPLRQPRQPRPPGRSERRQRPGRLRLPAGATRSTPSAPARPVITRTPSDTHRRSTSHRAPATPPSTPRTTSTWPDAYPPNKDGKPDPGLRPDTTGSSESGPTPP